MSWCLSDELRLRASQLPASNVGYNGHTDSPHDELARLGTYRSADTLVSAPSGPDVAFEHRRDRVFGNLPPPQQATDNTLDKEAFLKSLDELQGAAAQERKALSNIQPLHVLHPERFLKYSCQDVPLHDTATNNRALADTMAIVARDRRNPGGGDDEDGIAHSANGRPTNPTFIPRSTPQAATDDALMTAQEEHVRQGIANVVLRHLDDDCDDTIDGDIDHDLTRDTIPHPGPRRAKARPGKRARQYRRRSPESS